MNLDGFVVFGRESISKMGSENAAVLPVPVCAHPMRSFHARIIGIDLAWMGVGIVYPSASSARRMDSESPRV